MRLIDKDETLNRIYNMYECEWYGEIKAMPEIDPVHAAGGCYCRECRIRTGRETQKTVWCGYHNCSMRKNDFCSMGKMEENDG